MCSCLQGYLGSPPSCRPECVVSSECPPTRACVNKKCTDPCLGSCGLNARCEVINHSPICSCLPGQTGDPFKSCYDIPGRNLSINKLKPVTKEKKLILFVTRCFVAPPDVKDTGDPCNPSPCGPNAQCQNVNGYSSCSCLPTYIGLPPSCRPECLINPDCPSDQACINSKCTDPCPGSCAENARCLVVNHAVTCSCASDFTGNPFVQCVELESTFVES